MNIFSPANPGYSRGTPLSSPFSVSAGGVQTNVAAGTSYPNFAIEDVQNAVRGGIVPQFPTFESAYSSSPYIPSPVVKDCPFMAAGARVVKGTDQPLHNGFLNPKNEHYATSTDPATIFFQKGINDGSQYAGYYDAPFYRFNTIHYRLPEYFILDASDKNLTTITLGSDGDTIVIGLSATYNTKLLMRRDDRLATGNLEQHTMLDKVQYGDFVSTPQPNQVPEPVLDGDGNQIGWTSNPDTTYQKSSFAGYVPVYDISNQKAIVPGDGSNIYLICAPFTVFCDALPFTTNWKGFLSPVQWHILYTLDNQSPYQYPLLFTPYEGYYLGCKPTKERFAKWYSGVVPGKKDSDGTTDGSGFRTANISAIVAELGADGQTNELLTSLPGVYGEDLYNHFGHINLEGETKFLLTTVGFTNNLVPYDGIGAIEGAPKITIKPCYL